MLKNDLNKFWGVSIRVSTIPAPPIATKETAPSQSPWAGTRQGGTQIGISMELTELTTGEIWNFWLVFYPLVN